MTPMERPEAVKRTIDGKPPLSAAELAEEGEEHGAIDVVAEDGSSFIAVGSDVIEGAGKLDAKRSCHDVPRFPRSPTWLNPDS